MTANRKAYHRWTAEEIKAVRDLRKKNPRWNWERVTQAFNAIFKLELTSNQVKVMAYHNNIPSADRSAAMVDAHRMRKGESPETAAEARARTRARRAA